MDRGCSVSINACLTLSRLAPDARPSDVPGIRFEYSWGPGGLSPSTSQPTGGLRSWAADKVRYKTSSSGYGSGERSSESISRHHYNAAGSSVVAATLTLTHPQSSPVQSPASQPNPIQIQSPVATPSGRVIQPYERRCRSTCSITLQGLKSNGSVSPNGQNYPLRPFPSQEQQQQQRQQNLPSSLSLPLRRSSEGEAVAWNSHSKLPQLLASLTDSRCSVPTENIDPALVASAADSSKDAEVKRILFFLVTKLKFPF
jgi:hypothetical protein